MKHDLHTEIQQPVTNRGFRVASTETLSCCLSVLKDISVLRRSVHCSIVTFYCLAKENELSENPNRWYINKTDELYTVYESDTDGKHENKDVKLGQSLLGL
jgi:hypothetical protein